MRSLVAKVNRKLSRNQFKGQYIYTPLRYVPNVAKI